jgi:hypothetical protein
MLLAADGQPQDISSHSSYSTDEDFSHITGVRDVKIYLETIWQRYFSDVQCKNEVQIAYCSPWKTRLGMIRMTVDETLSFIGVNALLQHSTVPEYLLVTTIAHELVHYAHGFGSPLPRLYTHPHANNVVNRELAKRGLEEYVQLSDEWIDNYWFAFYQKERDSGWADIHVDTRALESVRNPIKEANTQ